LDDKVAFML